MFFDYCCSSDDDYFGDVRQDVLTLNPKMTPALVHAAHANWPVLVFMMALNMRADLESWFISRITTVEANQAFSQPSFELLAIALFLNKAQYLDQLASSKNMPLAEYLASRNNETDLFGYSLWHYAGVGMDPDFILDARGMNLIPYPRLPDFIAHPTKDLVIMRVFSTTYSRNPQAIAAALQFAAACGRKNIFLHLASSGCWHGLLICIILRRVDPHIEDVFFQLASACKTSFYTKAKDYWLELRRTSDLEQHVQAPVIPEVCLTYIAYRYNNREDAYVKERKIGDAIAMDYSRKCMDGLLQSCDWQQPQPVLLELLSFCSPTLLEGLSAENRKAISSQLRVLYPELVPYFFREEPEQRVPIMDREGSSANFRL